MNIVNIADDQYTNPAPSGGSDDRNGLSELIANDNQPANEVWNDDSRFRKLVENSYEGITLFDAQLNVIYRTRSAIRITGWSTNEREKNAITQLIHQDDLEYVTQNLATILKNPGTPINCEFRTKHFDGYYIWLAATFTNFLSDPDIRGIVCNFTDVTEARQKTRQLEEILNAVNDGFIILDENLHYTYVNSQVEKLVKIKKEDLLGKYLWDVFPDAIGSATYHGMLTALTEKRYICTEDYYAPLNLWQENHIYPTERGLFVFIRDISEPKTKEFQKYLLAEAASTFNEYENLTPSLQKILQKVAETCNICLAEVWLIGTARQKINLAGKYAQNPATNCFFSDSRNVKSYARGEGLQGIIWDTQELQHWDNIQPDANFQSKETQEITSLKSIYGVPIRYNNEIIGVLMLGLNRHLNINLLSDTFLKEFGDCLGAEIKRKQLEQELNQVFNFAPDIICIAGVDGYFKKINPAMCKILEYSEYELLNKPFSEFIFPEDRIKTEVEISDISKGKPANYTENRYVTGSGKIKWLSWTSTRVSEDGLLFCVAKDVTEKKDIEQLLNKATSLARIGAWEFDLKSNMIQWSAITREIHETDEGFNPTRDQAIEFYKDDVAREAILKIAGDAVNYGIPGDVEVQIVTAKGNEKWVRAIIEAEFADDKCIRLYGSFQDIDSRKKAEIAVKAALAERNTILESIGDAFFAVDKNWVVTYWNNMAEKALGLSKNEVLHRNIWEVLGSTITTYSYQKYHEAMATHQALRFEDYYKPLKKWYEVSAYPSVNGLSAYCKDITDRKLNALRLVKLNESLRKQTRELALSNAELEQFAYVASHDLQEPLRMVTSFLTQIEKKYGDIIDDKGKQYIHFAVDGAKRMRQIILDLLEFSRVGGSDGDHEQVDLNKIVMDLTALYRKKITDDKAKITADHLPTVRFHKTPIRQVLQNLVSNALKYHKPNESPTVHLSSCEHSDCWEIVVADKGIGIAPAYFNKIFIIFQQLHAKNDYPGTGMGLAIAKKIIENAGGKIWVESEEGIGSSFHFTILKNSKP